MESVSLTEFLLARIAEDEAEAHDHYSTHADGPATTEADCVECGDGYPCRFRRRMLAECEAKRRIVEGHKRPMILFGGAEHWAWELKALALPYADHPDYDEEWRP